MNNYEYLFPTKKERNMKKKYIAPTVEPTAVDMLENLLVSSVETGSGLHNEYYEGDVTYSRKGQTVWDDDEEEF